MIGTTGLQPVRNALFSLTEGAGIDPREAARRNLDKTQSRWPEKRVFSPLFDDGFPEEETASHAGLKSSFGRSSGAKTDAVVLRCKWAELRGSRNGQYRTSRFLPLFTTCFHFAYVVFLGWSPVIRALLKCKRKKRSIGGRKTRTVRGRQLSRRRCLRLSSAGPRKWTTTMALTMSDYDLLKAIQEFIQGFRGRGPASMAVGNRHS